MKSFTTVLCVGLCVIPALTRAADLRAVERACAASVVKQFEASSGHSCVSCNALWPQIAECVVANTHLPTDPRREQSCVDGVRKDYASRPMSFDRVMPVVSCVSARH